MPTTGTLSLHIGDEKVGEGRIMTQPGNFSLVGEGLNVGRIRPSRSPTTTRARRPYAFTGGTIRQAIVDVSASRSSTSRRKRSH